MNLDEFIQNFADQFDDTDISEFAADTKFRELEEWSSLNGMALIAMAKTVYGKALTGAELRSCETISDLFNLLNNK